MAEVNAREALIQAGVSQAQVEDVLRNLQSQQLVLAPAQAAPLPEAGTVELLRTDLWLESATSALSTRQLEELWTVCGLSQNDFDSLSDIVARRSRFHRCLVNVMITCLCAIGFSFLLLLAQVLLTTALCTGLQRALTKTSISRSSARQLRAQD